MVCAWSTHATVGSGRGWLGVDDARIFRPSALLAGRGRCTASTPEWLAGRNGSVHLQWGRSSSSDGLAPSRLLYAEQFFSTLHVRPKLCLPVNKRKN